MNVPSPLAEQLAQTEALLAKLLAQFEALTAENARLADENKLLKEESAKMEASSTPSSFQSPAEIGNIASILLGEPNTDAVIARVDALIREVDQCIHFLQKEEAS
jgi:hypothetical protein